MLQENLPHKIMRMMLILLLISCFSFTYVNEKLNDPDLLETQEDVISVLRDRYPNKIIKVYSLYDKIDSKSLLVCVNSDYNRCFISFNGRDQSLSVEVNGEIREIKGFFTPEIALAKFRNENHRAEDEHGNLTDRINTNIGHWFLRGDGESIKIVLSSTDGKFSIEWRKGEDLPRVKLL